MQPSQTFSFHRIGIVRTPFTSRYEAPRQPGTSKVHTVGTIILDPGQNFEQAVSDLNDFEYVWVLFAFDRNTSWKPMVLPPASDRKKRGVFATRSPHRPNPIGLSLCKLISIKGRIIEIENPDMLDGTPILDIKPYIPHTEAHPDAASGWIATAHEHVPPRYEVSISRPALAAIRQSGINTSGLETHLRTLLSRDPLPHPYRRIKKLEEGRFMIALGKWRFVYEVKGRKVRITEGREQK